MKRKVSQNVSLGKMEEKNKYQEKRILELDERVFEALSTEVQQNYKFCRETVK
jgi:hypothetical protein